MSFGSSSVKHGVSMFFHGKLFLSSSCFKAFLFTFVDRDGQGLSVTWDGSYAGTSTARTMSSSFSSIERSTGKVLGMD